MKCSVLMLALVACGDGDPAATDTVQTTQVADSVGADTEADTSVTETVASDVVQTHGTVSGTQLEGIATWFPDDGLELCSAWNEGASLADEKARKVRIHLGAKAGTTLDEDALRVPFSDVLVSTGPNRADHVRPASELTTSSDYTVTDRGGGLGTTLYATVSHELAGAGTLTESYTVSRTADDHARVMIDPATSDVSFYYQAAGSALAPTRLERCDVGSAAAEDAVSVVISRDAGKKTWAALVRYWRTNETDAGSAPATLLGHRLLHSGDYGFASDAMGFWSTTYSAQHHNHDEVVEVDYTRDLGKWHTVFRAPDPEATPVARVLLDGMRNPSGATLTIERLAVDGRTTEVLDVPDPMFEPRVDATALARTLSCEGADVLAAGAGDAWFQMLFCGEGQSRALVALVPIVWGLDIALSGTRIEGEAIKVVSGGWDVTIGNDVMTIRPMDDRYYTEVKRGEEVVAGASEIPYALGRPPEVMHSLVAAESADHGVSFAMDRLWAGYGVGKSQLWAPLWCTLTFGGATYSVDAWDAMTYVNTHHNWADTLEAVADDGTVLHWRVAFFDGIPNEVSATSSSGTVLLAPTVLPTP